MCLVYISLNNSPQAQMSTGLPYASFLKTSGDRYPGVPANPAETPPPPKQLIDMLKAIDCVGAICGSAYIGSNIIFSKI